MQFDEYLAAADANVDMLTELRDAAKTGDMAAVSKVGDAGQANSDKGKKIASELGLTECANDE